MHMFNLNSITGLNINYLNVTQILNLKDIIEHAKQKTVSMVILHVFLMTDM